MSATRKIASRVYSTSANLLRSFLPSLINVLISYVLLHYKGNELLNKNVVFLITVNLLMIVINWGVKDFLVREYSRQMSDAAQVFARVMRSKVPLVLVCCVAVCFVPLSQYLKLSVVAFIVFKSYNNLFEPLYIVYSRFRLITLCDVATAGLFICFLFWYSPITEFTIYAYLILSELVKCVANHLLFRKTGILAYTLKPELKFLAETRNYFLAALAGFLMSRADVYLVGLFLGKNELNFYHISLNLIGLAQIGYTAMVAVYSRNLFRLPAPAFHKTLSQVGGLGALLSLVSGSLVWGLLACFYKFSVSYTFVMLTVLNLLSFSFVLPEMYRYTYYNRNDVSLRLTVASGLLSISSGLVLIPLFKMEGALLSNTLGSLLLLGLSKFYFRKQSPVISPPQ